jgi:hypothetical protein
MTKYRCPLCLADVTMTTEGKWRKHGDCENSGKPVAPALIMAGQSDAKDDEPKKGRDYDTCPACGRDPRLDENLAFRPHVIEKGSDEKCPFSGRNKTGKDPLTTARPLLSNKPAKKKEEACIPCPEPGCGRTPSLNPDGSIGVHMQVKMGDKVCPSSNQRITTVLSPTQVLKSEELPPPATASATGIAADTTPIAQSSTTPVATLPTDALTPESTPRDTVTPNPADAPGTSEHAPELPPASPEQAEHLRIAESILRSEHSCPRTDGTHDVDCVKSFKPRICMHCKKAMEAKHECWIFTPAGEALEWCGTCKEMIAGHCDVCGRVKNPIPYSETVFVKPDPIPHALDVQPMTGLAAQIAAQMKEIFHAYSNRMERTLQTTLGPSEIGSPCDRRLAMSLMHIPPVSPGMDGWAAFVGTCIHTGLAEMLTWADANTGRFAVEVPLTFPSEYVPKGTSDLLDRVLMVVDDHKAMGRFSLDELRTKGPRELYRVQLHTYAYGQVAKGEKVKWVAIVAWPREQNSLKDLYVWVEPYQPEIAQKAIARVDAIAGEVKSKTGLMQPLEIAKDFDVADDCKFCPFLAKGDPGMTRGCPGRK